MTIQEYIKELNKQFSTTSATEHSYRPALKSLLETILPASITVINEPKRSDCGAPDYILQKGDMPIAFLEAKDFAKSSDLGGRKENKEQFDRYKKSLDNIIFTDYLDFWLYDGGEFVGSVKIAELKGDKIVAVEESEAKFNALVSNLANASPQKVTSASRLAAIMAGKARLLADVICKAIKQDVQGQSELCGQMNAFREVLISDIKPESFADIYAQTIAYGMFAARLHDTTPDDFSRQEAATLIPKTNPFLRQIFQSIAGYDLDERIAWIVDDLASVFRVTDVAKVMRTYGERTRQTDPILHFYEDFLSAYDPALRKSRGVWYTPQPVVNYIVRAVDEILQKEFNLPMGLADTSKIKVEQSVVQSQDKRFKDNKKKVHNEYHRVQILDPAVGTGTFLAEVVQAIYQKYRGQQGMWQSYVEEHLVPRLNGFEILMASYAMAHLKLDMLLGETGYVASSDKRLKVYLTNSLEEHHLDTGTLFVQALANEANQANHLKRDTPVMVVVGNPPYSGVSSNNGEWIRGLMDSYKKEPGGVQKLKERKHWLNDDYCKFIRLGQEFVDRNSEGVLAYINNHSFLDNPTFRGMRWSLMESFDKIYIIDLHGNSKKKEVCPDGSKDENVFDIQQGVSINIFVKTNEGKAKGELAEVFHYDLYGKRQTKYDFLAEYSFVETPFAKLEPKAPMYFFVPKNNDGQEEYENGFRVDELFQLNTSGIVTMGDKFAIADTKDDLKERISDFATSDISKVDFNHKYDLGKNYCDFVWSIKGSFILDENKFVKIEYRPFDTRWTYFDNKIIWRPRTNVMSHMLSGENVGLVTARSTRSNSCDHFYITKNIVETKCGERTIQSYVFPLYLYPSEAQIDGTQRVPNLKPDIVQKFAQSIGLEFENEKSDNAQKFAPMDLLDYIYGVLHTPAYRERYKEFLKVDFPRIPYPKSAQEFSQIAKKGGELRRVHLMEELPQIATQFPVGGDNAVESITAQPSETHRDKLKVYINDTQYFGEVPKSAWEFYIGGYQPAQKWLKDRKGKTLTFDDLQHYQRIIVALMRTAELMKEL